MSRRKNKKRRGARFVCPVHSCRLAGRNTKYGGRYSCPVDGCTVVCWSQSTSTPADQETRDARHALHRVFDPLWQDGGRFANRREAYLWLADVMGLHRAKTHIGYFNLDQCQRAMAAIRKLGEEILDQIDAAIAKLRGAAGLAQEAAPS